MHELKNILPTSDALLALEPDALGLKILAILLKRTPNLGMFHLGNLLNELWPYPTLPGYQYPYPQSERKEIDQAVTEAWTWLEREGLIVPAPDTNGQNGWRVLSRSAARRVANVDLSNRAAPLSFPKQALHSRIVEKAWADYLRGDFDSAVFEAMKAVEISVREAAGYSDDKIGVQLMQDAFSPNKGPLADLSAPSGEQTARMFLFSGAIGSYKNPQSHRDVNLGDPVEALEIVLLANHLLRIVDSRVKARSVKP